MNLRARLQRLERTTVDWNCLAPRGKFSAWGEGAQEQLGKA